VYVNNLIYVSNMR